MTFRTRPPPNSNGTPFSFLFLHLSFSLFLHCFCSLSLLSINSIPGVNVRCFLGMKISLYCLAMKRKRGKTRNPSSLAADEMFPNVSQKSNNVHLQTEFWVSNQNQFLSSHITWSIWVLIVLNRALMNVKRKTMMWWQARAHLLSAATHTHTHLRAITPQFKSPPHYAITVLPCYHDAMIPPKTTASSILFCLWTNTHTNTYTKRLTGLSQLSSGLLLPGVYYSFSSHMFYLWVMHADFLRSSYTFGSGTQFIWLCF